MPEFKDEIILLQLVVDLGGDYGVIKYCSVAIWV